MTLYKQGKYTNARQYFANAYVSATNCQECRKPYYRMQELLSNIAICYMQQHKWDSAACYFDSGLAFIATNAARFESRKMKEQAEAVIYNNLAEAMFYLGKPDSSNALLIKSINIYMQPEYDHKLAFSTQRTLLTLCWMNKDYKKMDTMLRAVRKKLDESPDIHAEVTWLSMESAYWEGIAKYDSSLKYYREYVKIEDSLKNTAAGSSHADIAGQLHDKEQQYRIATLEKDKKLSRSYLLLTIGIIVFSLFIIVLVYVNYQKSRQKNRLISEQKTALEKSMQEKDQILNIVAHDLRNPAGSIAYLADIMLMGESSMAPEEAFAMIKNSSQSALHLINELVASGTDNGGDMLMDATDINALLKECVQLITYRAKEKNQHIDLILAPLPAKICIDHEKIMRVITNLVVNAIKFSMPGAGIRVSVEYNAADVVIAVKDNGIGIPLSLQPGLFEMFSPDKRTGTNGERSYGLGLSISRKIIAAHKGSIWMESTEGRGSTFFVKLPRH